MRRLLAELGIESWKDAVEMAGTILALLVIVAGTGLGMVVTALLAGVPLR